jgi:hypothetical protein
LTFFDLGLEFAQALERNADGELHAKGIEQPQQFLVAEGTVEPALDLKVATQVLHLDDVLQDEPNGAVGVVDFARPEEHIDHLASLGAGAQQGVVAASTLALLVEPDRGPLRRPAAGSQ